MIGHSRFGHGPRKVLVLPGLPGDHSLFDGMLAAVDPDIFEYLFAEYRGTGLSLSQAGEFTLDEILGDLDELLKASGWRRCHAIGHSVGGFVAQRLAASWPTRIESLALIAPIPASGPPFDAAGLDMLRRACRNDGALLQLGETLAAGRLTTAWQRWFVAYTRRLLSTQAAESYFDETTRHPFAAELAGNPIPALIVLGEHDPAYTKALMADTLLRWLPKARLEVLPQCGHFPMMELPLLLAARLERFFTAPQ